MECRISHQSEPIIPKQTIEKLLKCKLDELHQKAVDLGININNENGKKKRKADLAEEIFNKLD